MSKVNGIQCNGGTELSPELQQMVDEWLKLDRVSTFSPYYLFCLSGWDTYVLPTEVHREACVSLLHAH